MLPQTDTAQRPDQPDIRVAPEGEESLTRPVPSAPTTQPPGSNQSAAPRGTPPQGEPPQLPQPSRFDPLRDLPLLIGGTRAGVAAS